MRGDYEDKIGANLGHPVPVLAPPSNTPCELTEEPGAVNRVSVADIARQLRRRIATHDIPPGSRLREWDVAAEFGVARLSAREALEMLVHLGFVDRQPNRGIVVRRRELPEILRLFDMREVNEGLCARLAASGPS